MTLLNPSNKLLKEELLFPKLKKKLLRLKLRNLANATQLSKDRTDILNDTPELYS